MKLKPKTTWYVVCDESVAFFFESQGTGASPTILDQREAEREISLAQVSHDPHGQAALTSLSDIADFINQAASNATYDHLVLVVAPSALVDLRPLISDQAEERLIALHTQNLVHLTAPQLVAHLEDLIP